MNNMINRSLCGGGQECRYLISVEYQSIVVDPLPLPMVYSRNLNIGVKKNFVLKESEE